MKVGLFASSVVTLFFSQALSADCYNWEDENLKEASVVEFCLDGNCITTKQAWECGNTHWTGAGFYLGNDHNGITVECEVVGVGCEIKFGGIKLSSRIKDQFFSCRLVKPSTSTQYADPCKRWF